MKRRIALVLLAWSLAAPLRAEPAAAVYEQLQRLGEHWPQRALQALEALPPPQGAEQRRAHAQTRAVIIARGGAVADAEAADSEAVIAAAALAPTLAAPEGLYLRVLRGERDGSPDVDETARRALAGYATHCHDAAPGCELPARWRLLQILARRAWVQRSEVDSRLYAQQALALAEAAGDTWRQALSQAQLAANAAQADDRPKAELHLQRALALARRSGDAEALGRVLMTEAVIANLGGDPARALRALQRALAASTQADTRRLTGSIQANIADTALRAGQPARALKAAEAGLPLVQALRDRRLERVLLANRLVARLRLGQATQVRQELDALLAAWSAEGDFGSQVTTLREYSDALAETGDLAGALAAYHRERALAQQLAKSSRSAALAELGARYDRVAQQRRIEALEHDNAVKSAELETRALHQRLWMLGGGAVALALVAAGLLALRLRETNRALAHSQNRLRLMSERDALTGLANRRYLQRLLRTHCQGTRGFQGGLLLLDIDHFKQINDRHGHAAGDAVLVEVARRLQAALRAADALARWGGEEFLVLTPADGESTALARRLLHAVGATPVQLPDGRALQVTVSIGHAGLPLPTQQVPLEVEPAINAVDMALYLAKAHGRNRAVGLAQSDATDAAALREQVGDLETAWQDGRVQLSIEAGPVELPDAPASAPAETAADPDAARAPRDAEALPH